MTIVLSEEKHIVVGDAADCRFENCYISDGQPEAAHASTEVGIDPTVADDLEDFGLIRALFSVAALWGVVAIIGAIAGVIWSMP